MGVSARRPGVIGRAVKGEVTICEPRRCVLQHFSHLRACLPYFSRGASHLAIFRLYHPFRCSSTLSRHPADERVARHLRPGYMTPRYELFPGSKKYSIR